MGAHCHLQPKMKVSQSKRGRVGTVQRSGKDLEVRFILLITESKIQSLNLVDFVLRSKKAQNWYVNITDARFY